MAPLVKALAAKPNRMTWVISHVGKREQISALLSEVYMYRMLYTYPHTYSSPSPNQIKNFKANFKKSVIVFKENKPTNKSYPPLSFLPP